MTVEEAVQAILTGNAGVTALCPAPRIKPDGLYQSLTRPYIVHFIVAMEELDTHDSAATLKKWPYQIMYFGDSVAMIVPLRLAVMSAIKASVYPAFLNVSVSRPPNGLQSLDTTVIGEAITADVWYE